MTTQTHTAPDRSLVYVRVVALDDLPETLREEAVEGGLEQLYALHRSNGEQMALVADRGMAFQLARQNDLSPVSVH